MVSDAGALKIITMEEAAALGRLALAVTAFTFYLVQSPMNLTPPAEFIRRASAWTCPHDEIGRWNELCKKPTLFDAAASSWQFFRLNPNLHAATQWMLQVRRYNFFGRATSACVKHHASLKANF